MQRDCGLEATGGSCLNRRAVRWMAGLQRNARYVSENPAPRAVYEAKLTGTLTRTRISNLFSSSGAFVDDASESYDTLVVHERAG